MRSILIFSFPVFSFSFLNAQTEFEYDPSGNRTVRRTFVLSSPASSQAANAFISTNEDGFPASGAMEMPESNDLLDKFYADKLNESDVLIYPNPTKGVLAIKIQNKNPKISHLLTVYNINGSTIFQQNHIGDYTQIDLSTQPKGMYFLRISAFDTFITWKIIKE